MNEWMTNIKVGSFCSQANEDLALNNGMISIFVTFSSFLITVDTRTALFWVIMQRLVVIFYRRFRTTCPSDYWLLKMRIDRERNRQTERHKANSWFWNFADALKKEIWSVRNFFSEIRYKKYGKNRTKIISVFQQNGLRLKRFLKPEQNEVHEGCLSGLSKTEVTMYQYFLLFLNSNFRFMYFVT